MALEMAIHGRGNCGGKNEKEQRKSKERAKKESLS
jgi:hypothetical protein